VCFNVGRWFVMTSKVVIDAAMRIHLPEWHTADTQAAEQVIITLTREGETYVGELVVDLAELPGILQQKLSEVHEPSVKIKADQAAPVGMLIKVVDGVRLSGCNAFSIITERQ